MSNKKKGIRARFRSDIFERDQHRCRVCGATGKLDAHHIMDRTSMPNGGYVKANGISLCEACHLKAELWHSSGYEQWSEGYLPRDLYALIGSSYEQAVRDSCALAGGT